MPCFCRIRWKDFLKNTKFNANDHGSRMLTCLECQPKLAVIKAWNKVFTYISTYQMQSNHRYTFRYHTRQVDSPLGTAEPIARTYDTSMSIPIPPTWPRNSTAVTSEPSRDQTEPSSTPITPAPISINLFGTCLSDKAPVDEIIVSSSTCKKLHSTTRLNYSVNFLHDLLWVCNATLNKINGCGYNDAETVLKIWMY